MAEEKIKKIVHFTPDFWSSGGPSGYNFALWNSLNIFPSKKYDIVFYSFTSIKIKQASIPRGRYGKIKLRIRNFIVNHKIPRALSLRFNLENFYDFMFRKDSDLEMALRADLVVVHNIETLDKIMRYIDRQRTAVAIIQHGPTTSTYQNATNFDPNMTVTEAKEYPIVNKIHQKELGFYKTVDFIICPCPEAMEAYSDFYPEWNSIMKDKMAICLTGTHRPQIINSREEWRKKLNIPETAVMAVYIGRYHPHKGFDILMQAVELAQKKIDKEFYLVCAGGRDAGQKKIKNVLHIGYTNDVGGLLNASDFMINSNKYSFFDLSILEALSLSKPILLTDAGGNKEIKRLIPEIEMVKTNALDLADGIIKMINKNLNADTGAISEKYKKHFSPSAFVENHEKLYDFIFQKFSKK